MECSQRTTSIPNCFKNGVQNQQNKYLDRKNLNDKENLPNILKKFDKNYVCELHKDYEEDFICFIRQSNL